MRAGFLLLIALSCLGQDAKTPERAKKVVESALQAMGGEKYLAMKDRVEEGRSYSFYHERMSGMSRAKMYTRYLTAPEPMTADFFGLRERRAFGKKEDVFIVYNEDGGYEITYRGAKPLEPAIFNSYKESLLHNVLYTLRMRLKEPGLTFESKGIALHENQPCEVVDIVDGESRVTTVWFHQSTKLPLKQRWERRDPKTRERIEEITIFDKYRDVGGGVMWPFVIRRERNGERNYEIYADAVSINQGLGDDLFTLSADVKVLETKGSNVRPGKK